MDLEVYAILDCKLSAFARPFFVQNDAVAMRAFGDAVMEKGSPYNAHPEDYVLYRLARFSSETGDFLDVGLRSLAKGTDFFDGLKEVK